MKSKAIINDTNKSGHTHKELIACHECDFLHSVQPVPVGGKALCVRCGAFLYQNIPNSLDRALALNLAAFMFFIMANTFPFLSLELGGRVEENVLISGALALFRLGMSELGALVFLTSVLFPIIVIAGMLYVLLPLKFGFRASGMSLVFRLVQAMAPWSLISVFMLGALVSFVKLLDLATVIPGISLFSFAAFLVASSAANANLVPSVIWPRMDPQTTGKGSGRTAVERGLVACYTCSLVVPKGGGLDDYGHDGYCPRCQSPLHSRKTNSIARTWALVAVAILLFIPANVYPVMTIVQFGKGDPNTILGGVIHLIEGGMWGLGMIILFASIVVPGLKLIVLSFLLITVRKKSTWRFRDRTLLYRVTEAVGSWSMVDIYVVAILVALVNFGSLSTITPGLGASFFAAMVVSTMLAAHTFDPRLIWDENK